MRHSKNSSFESPDQRSSLGGYPTRSGPRMMLSTVRLKVLGPGAWSLGFDGSDLEVGACACVKTVAESRQMKTDSFFIMVYKAAVAAARRFAYERVTSSGGPAAPRLARITRLP